MTGMIPDAGLTATRADSALWYASLGWPVFPIRPGTKVPATRHGFQDGTTDPERIRRWWDRHPDHNIAIATGAPGPDVLDVDVRDAGDGWAAFNRLTGARLLAQAFMLVRTPSLGAHIYFAGTDQSCRSLPKHHLDLKARGGYVVAPPSRVDGAPLGGWSSPALAGHYDIMQVAGEDSPAGAPRTLRWDAVLAVLDPPKPVAAPRDRAPGGGEVTGLASWLATQAEGNRNSALFWAACRAAQTGCTDMEPLVQAAVSTGLTELEARRTVASAERRRV